MTALSFEIVSATASRKFASPTIAFRLAVREAGDARVDAIVVRVQVQIQPRKRQYDDRERHRLVELFGEPARWDDTLHTVVWAQNTVAVPSFTRYAEIELPVSIGYDFEVSSNVYFDALASGDIPLQFLFSGTIFTTGERGLQVGRIPWDLEASYRLPVAVYREAVDFQFPNAAWIRIRKDLFDELYRFKTAAVHPTWDSAIEALLNEARAKR